MQFLKRISMLAIFLLALGISASAQVNVTATGGTLNATYTTVGGAFTAINAGTHTGAITLDITASTTETGAAVLNSTGAGTASYTSVLIRPTADGVTVGGSATAASGRGVIELNGADNVTIDGDNPNTAGINSNLTVINNNPAATTYTSVIRIALSTLITSANGNTVRNCILTGSATGQNVSTVTGTTSAANTTYGILVGGGGSTAAATTAPSAITSVATTIAAGQTATNFTASGNTVNAVARGIAVQGAAITVATGLSVTNNTIGAAAAGSATTVYSMGMTLQGFSSATVSGNTVRNIESFLAASIRAIDFGAIAVAGTNAIVERNFVNRVFSRSTTTFGAYGIQVALSVASNTTIRNNFVADISHDITSGAAFVDGAFAPFGIRISSGTTYNVYHNSVNLFGVSPGTATATSLGSAAFAITGTGLTNIDARNNIFANTQSGGAAPIAYVSIFLPAAGTSAMNLTLNNNDYFSGTGAGQGIAQVGTAAAGTLYTAANFDPATTTPATNLRAYTSTLSTAGTNDNASRVVDPLFVSNTDLHISAASPLVDAGASVGVTNDFDRDLRVDTPDIGGDETDGVAPPANDIAAGAIIAPAPNSGVFTGTIVTPQATFSNVGLSAQSNVQVQFTITGPGGYSYTNTQTIASIGSDQTVTVTFAAAPAFTTAGTYTATATVLTADGNSMNNSTTATFNVVPLINGGAVNVGTGQTYTSLTNSGGVFSAINAGTVTSNITINITSNLTGETGAVALNEIAGGFTVLIKPTGAARTISGTSSATAGILNFNGSDNVTIDGSLAGGTDRSLTISSANAGATGGGIYFASGATGAQNNTVRNVNVAGNGSITGLLLGITFAGNAFGGPGADNDNNRIENCDVRGAFYGIASLGASSANKDTGTVITRNVMPATGTAGIGRVGIYILNNDGGQITQNNIASVANPGSVDTIGIAAGSQGISNAPLTTGNITNANISRNYVGVVSNNATFSSAGIVLVSDTSGTNNVVNNMVAGVTGNSNAGDIVVGIYINPLAGATQNVYNNSVSMTGDRLPITTNMLPSYALVVSADQPVNVINNILVNSQTRTGSTGGGGESYAFGFDGPAANANLNSNYNDLFVSGPLGQVGITGDLITAAQTTTAGTGTNQTTLAAWQAATGEDANSISSDPLFVSATDLHIPSNSPVVNVGTTSAGVTVDFDGQTRDATPDIGADEFVVLVPGTIALSAATYSVNENVAGGTFTIPVNRTGGTDGAVSVAYTLGGGTATGGPFCVSGVDYISAGSSVNFATGASTGSITVTICDDAVFEGNETFNVTLGATTGGASLGMPSSAVVTIVDDEVAQPGTLQFNPNTAAVVESAGTVALTVTRTGGTDGVVGATYTLGGGTATGAGACAAGVDYVNTGGTVSFINGASSATITVTICNDTVNEPTETFVATLSVPTGGAALGANTTATVTITDDDMPAGLTGTINVGATETYTSLTNTGGAFEALNTQGATGNITFAITSDLTAETGTVALNEVAGGFTVLIKPTGAARTISGSSTTGIIRINGADNVTIDGSLTGGTATGVGGDATLRNLTVQNTSTTATAGAVIAILQGTNGALNDTVRNVNVAGQDPSQTLIGIFVGGNTIGGSPTINNTNSRIENCSVQRAILGIFNNGVTGTPQTGTVITRNDLSATGANRLRRAGIFFFNQDGIQVTENSIGGIATTESADSIGIIAGTQNVTTTSVATGGVVNALISRNRINGIVNNGTVGFSAVGIAIAGGTTGANTISNNMITGVNSNGTSPDLSVGIFVTGVPSSTTRLYYNSVAMTGDRGTLAAQIGSYAVAISGTNPAVELKNNIFYNTQTAPAAAGTAARSYAIGLQSTTFTNFNSNNNDFFTSGANAGFFRTGGLGATATDYANLAAFRAATGSDANSLEVDPLFVDPTSNLHIQATSPVQNLGTPIAGVTVDFDGETRSTTTPDIGADEIAGAPVNNGALQFNPTTYSVNEPAGTVALTVTRTGGTDGAVSATYTLGGGTATGGAACGGNVDYINTGGTVSFIAGASTATINVTICNDTLVESNETFVATLSVPTGGATLGANTTATVTIVSEDVNNFGSFSINDVRVLEGDSGTTNAVFTVTFTPTAPFTTDGGPSVSVNYTTANGTATAGVDYTATTGTVSFGGVGTQTQTIIVPVIGDTVKEANETFFVNLSGAVNSTIGDNQGVGIIIDEDRAYVADFDGDEQSDLSVFRASTGFWYVLQSTNNQQASTLFGANGDIPVPGDYDADGRTDFAVFRPSNGVWYIQQSSNFAFVARQFGISTDKPVQGDYDGDSRTDLAVYRDGVFYVFRSTDNTPTGVFFGTATDIPVQGDYDGDNRTDYAVFRPSNGTWYTQSSATNATTAVQFGANGDRPLVGDFDGDGKADKTVYRAGIWYILQSLTNTVRAVAFGVTSDIPVPADYDGDGTTDIGVFRPDGGIWYSIDSSNNNFRSTQFGQTGDVPIPAAYQFQQPQP